MEQLAQIYSRSLFEAAREHGRLDEVKQQLGQFTDTLESEHDFAVFFFSPYFSTDEKKQGLRRAITDADPLLVNFLELLVENHRMPIVFRARKQYESLWDREHRRLPVEVTSAVELDQAIVDQLGERIGEQTGQNVELKSTVDAEILGGIVLRVGNSVLDASIRSKLEKLRTTVAA
ncbi:MAG: ATP synthase F1 subunit delta [Solirubrobacterales bacterium]